MHTVFSHIIQKRFSRFNEDVATDALAYVLESSDSARRGMTKFLRGIVPELPEVRFLTQQSEGTIRPDMWGYADTEPRVFVENKFWAGLTESQPIAYLKQLAEYSQPTLLLVIGPAAREHTLWRELTRRLLSAGVSVAERDSPVGVFHSLATQLGPILALTSWTDLLAVLTQETSDDPAFGADLVQLRALCDSADLAAFVPISATELSDQRTPAFMLHLGSVVQEAVELAVAENALDTSGLRPQGAWDRIGRYARFSGDTGAGMWLGIHFGLWKSHGVTPLWVVFSESEFGRAREVRLLIEPWASNTGLVTATKDQEFAVALAVPAGEEKGTVIRCLVDDLKRIATVLEALPPRTATTPEEG